jgi:hypothetical protein
MQMRFGGLEAKDIGITNFHRPRAPSSVNRDIEESDAARELQLEIKKDPEWEGFVRHWIKEGHSAVVTSEALSRAKMYMWLKRKMGASPKTLLRYWP